jgi:chromate reductase
MTTHTVAIVVGSLRKDSLNRKMANALIKMAPASLSMSIVEIADLPHFNQDWEENPPQNVLAFRQKIKAANAVLLLTPEYNRSVPGVLKNAVDVASRPYGQGVWIGKPGAVISVSPGPLAGFGANHHLRQVMTAVGIKTMSQPEAYVGNATAQFDADGTLIDASTIKFMDKFLNAFVQWIERNKEG